MMTLMKDLSNIEVTPHILAPPKECYLWGLLKGKQFSRNNVVIRMVEGRD